MELLIVVLILGILAATIIPRYTVSAAEAKKTACAENCTIINRTIERWHFEKHSWPTADLTDIGTGPNFFPDGLPTCPVNGQPYTIDATTHRVAGHGH